MYLIYHVTSLDQESMRIHGWKLFVLCHSADKSCDHKHCNGGDKMFLIYHVTSREHVFKGLCEFMGENLSR